MIQDKFLKWYLRRMHAGEIQIPHTFCSVMKLGFTS